MNSVPSKRCHEFYQSGAMNSALSGAMNAAMASHAVPWLMQPRLMISEALQRSYVEGNPGHTARFDASNFNTKLRGVM